MLPPLSYSGEDNLRHRSNARDEERSSEKVIRERCGRPGNVRREPVLCRRVTKATKFPFLPQSNSRNTTRRPEEIIDLPVRPLREGVRVRVIEVVEDVPSQFRMAAMTAC